MNIDFKVPRAQRGFIKRASEAQLYFATHAVYFATRYGSRDLSANVRATYRDQIGPLLRTWFYKVLDPNREIKMELAASALLCGIDDRIIREYADWLQSAVVVTATGNHIYRDGSLLNYQIHSQIVYLNLLAVAYAAKSR